MRPNLKIVPEEPVAEAAHQPKQLSDAIRYAIMNRDWANVHIAADRRAPFGRVWR